jgi:hypothetical protein
MPLLYGESRGNAFAAVRFYRDRFPNRRVPSRQTFVEVPKCCGKPGYFSLQCVDKAHNDQIAC